MANYGNRLNGRVEITVVSRHSVRIFCASISALSVAGVRTIRGFMGSGTISYVIGYTTCATISGTRSSRTATHLIGIRTIEGVTAITRRGGIHIIRISASCIFSNGSYIPCARSVPIYPAGICKGAGLSNRHTLRRVYPRTIVIHAT